MPDTSNRPDDDDITIRKAAMPPGVPRWVKILAIVGVVALVLIVVAVVGGHGPGRHVSSGVGAGTTPRGGYMVAGARSHVE